jgi:two-component system NarL family sensor kinase
MATIADTIAQELVAAREEERRRLRRELHDGLGPTQAAMTLRIDVALELIGAIEECTERFCGSARAAEQLDVDLDLPRGLPALPAAIEVAALRIVQEALANVAHHSGARACGVRLEVGGAVAIEVSDDGEGLPADYRPGVGLHSMRERAAELGGTCAIEPRRPRGTRVLAELPLAMR